MIENVAITADSTCDLSPDLIARYGIRIIPLHVTMGEDTYTDGVDLSAPQIFDYVSKTGILPKTSAVSISEYAEVFSSLVSSGRQVIHINIGSQFSSTGQNARLAAEVVGAGKVFVIDSEYLSTGSGHIVLSVIDFLENGVAPEDIPEKIKEVIPRVDASFILGNLEYMKKGGRCSSVAVLGANLLNLKACIEVKDGAMGVAKKYRGNLEDVLKKYVDDRLSQPAEAYETKRVFITSTCTKDRIPLMIRDYVASKGIFDEILVTTAGSTVTSHCGKNTLGVLFIRK